MPLRLNVGVSKKVGLPAYSSIGASCHLDLELENGLLRDPAGFRDQVREAFVVAQQAVDDELARLQVRDNPDEVRPTNGRTNDHHASHGTPVVRPEVRRNQPGKPATTSQIRAIVAIARRQQADLDGLLCDLGVTRPEELTLADASRLIDQLKAAATA
jgi:hypothetical protein